MSHVPATPISVPTRPYLENLLAYPTKPWNTAVIAFRDRVKMGTKSAHWVGRGWATPSSWNGSYERDQDDLQKTFKTEEELDEKCENYF